MKNSFKKKLLSLLLCVLLAVSGIVPAFSAFAEDGVDIRYDVQIFYDDTDTMVPSYQEDGETDFYISMVEGEKLQLKHEIIDGVIPDNAYFNWYSDNPVLVDVDQNGLVKAFDSSKGAVVQLWIDNEVKPIPLIGSRMGELLEKAFNNDYVDLDTLDTEAIKLIAKAALGSESWLADYLDAYEGDLIDSLGEYLDRMNTAIYCQLLAADGTVLGYDAVHIAVERNNEWYANFLPIGTHITNKSKIATTQAVGNTVQLQAITSPQRLHYGVQYSVKASSIFTSGKVVATVTDGGLVTFKKTGTVTILASPDSEDVINGLLKFINYFYTLENTGTLNTDDIAQIMIEYMGLDINRAVLAGMLDVVMGAVKIYQGTADPVQLTATVVEIVANIILQMRYNDSITFTVVEAEPIESFDIVGSKTVKEGSQIQLELDNVQPSTGDKSDVVWTSSDPTVARVDEKTGIITGLDAGGPYGQLSTKDVQITATSTTNDVSKTYTVTVVGKTGNFISQVDINGSRTVEIGGTENLTYTVYPKRAASAPNLYIQWGILTDEVDEEGNPVYEWATYDQPAANDIAQITSGGKYTALDGGKTTVAVKAYTGYRLNNGNFYEVSSFTQTAEISTGIPVEDISIAVTGVSNSGGKIASDKTVKINGNEYHYVTITRSGAYLGNGAVVKATVKPNDATNKDLTWVIDNDYYENELSDNTHTAKIKQKVGHEVADTFNVYAVSNDGTVKSNVITVCVSNNHITENSIDGGTITLDNNTSKAVTHSVTYNGSLENSNMATAKANWYSSDEDIFTVKSNGDSDGNAVITANDVGEATIYCVTADSGVVATAKVVVKPNKKYLKNTIDLCEQTPIIRTNENKKQYQQYMRKLDLAYSVYYDQDMASQTTCDTYAQNLLTAFYKLGGFISLLGVEILGPDKTQLDSDYITVNVGTTTNYKKVSYDLDYKTNPVEAMYSEVEWTSSSSSISVDSNGVCTPTANDPCAAIITCRITDYMGHERSDSVYVAFARVPATGVNLNYTKLSDQKVGEATKLVATVLPSGTAGIGAASCKTVFWETSDEDIATVDDNGIVTPVAGGDCVITCTTADGGYQATCSVNVVTNYDMLQDLIQSYADLNLSETGFYPETWEVYTAALSEAEVMLRTRGYSQKEVDEMQAKLEAAYSQLERYTYLTSVEIYIDGRPTSEFYQYDASLLTESISGEGIGYTNASLDLNVRLVPNNASYQTVTWESDTSDISVTNEGVASPTSNKSCYGRITCTVTDHFDNSYSDSVWVSFAYTPVTALKLSDHNINGEVGETVQLACTVEPVAAIAPPTLPASIQDYYWESDDESIATVSTTGLVTFVSAGSTIIRAVSYDGGIKDECVASTEGDRSALRAAIEEYKNVDYTRYEYYYGQDFKTKYDIAVSAMTDVTLTQEQIDSIAQAVFDAATEMFNHPYIRVEQFVLSYESNADPLSGSDVLVEKGLVDENDHLTINLSRTGYQSKNNRNYIDISAAVYPTNASYQTLEWSVVSSSNMKKSDSDLENGIRLTPDGDNPAWAKIKIAATDNYGRETSRIVWVVMADNIASSFSLTDSSLTAYATDAPIMIGRSFGGSPDVKAIEWSSSDESVVTVDQYGYFTPVNTGEAVITAVSVDGGFTATVNITIFTDYEPLAEKVSEYKAFLEEVQSSEEQIYTESSINVLAAAIAECETVIMEELATQNEVNSYIETLDAAYNALETNLPATGIKIVLDGEQEGVTEENEGFFRNTVSSKVLADKTIQFKYVLLPEDKETSFETIEWTSSNRLVTVDKNFGTVTNMSGTGSWAVITCTVTVEGGTTYSDSVYVSFVGYGATAVTFDSELIYGAPEQTKALEVNLNQPYPSNMTPAQEAIYKGYSVNDCLYESTDESIATVDEDGNVTFHNQGTCQINVTALDGGYTGSITAYTTLDTTSLQQAIKRAEKLTYTDYEYEYGIALQDALELANYVLDNPYAPQEEIDAACASLLEAITNAEDNPFIAPNPTIKIDGEEFENGAEFNVANGGEITASYVMNEDAMIKTASWNVKSATGASTEISDGDLVITKTGDETATVIFELVTVDDYNRAQSFERTVYLVDGESELKYISSITLTADGNEISNSALTYSGLGNKFSGFDGVQLAYVASPEDAIAPVSVEWSSSVYNRIAVDENGYVYITDSGRNYSLKTLATTITCTVTNADGSTARATVLITLRRS